MWIQRSCTPLAIKWTYLSNLMWLLRRQPYRMIRPRLLDPQNTQPRLRLLIGKARAKRTQDGALKEIKYFQSQQSPELLIPRVRFQRLVKEVVEGLELEWPEWTEDKR